MCCPRFIGRRMKYSSKISSKSSLKAGLPWPIPRQGAVIPVVETSRAAYSVMVGLSEWAGGGGLPWVYFLPTRRELERVCATRCGGVARLVLISGFDGSARRKAEAIFARVCAALRKQAAWEGGGVR
jgi:hypothetical protein